MKFLNLKKKSFWLIVASIVVIGSISGTTAYFTKEFISDNNVVTAAAFDVDVVDSNGNPIADGQFNLDGDLFPGMDTLVAYQFDVKRNNTELPYEYTVDLSKNGDLFPEDGSSPIVVTMQKLVDDEWVDVDLNSTFFNENDVETYRILVDWPHGDNDIEFQGLTGTLKLEVVATQVDMPKVPEETGELHIMLYKDSTASRDRIDFDTISNFYIKSKDTGLTYSEGSVMWNNKAAFIMLDIPIGEYTVHFDSPDVMYTKDILVGPTYYETDYDPDSNPIVIEEDVRSYVKVVLRSNIVLDYINPVDDLIVPSDITLEEFRDALPKHTTIVDSEGNEHQVDLRWDVRPFVFDSWKKPGQYTLWSEGFDLPLLVSNTEPRQRLEVRLNVIFE